jgi:radical SAM protein with 4Fe4S-binding SPASM domain
MEVKNKYFKSPKYNFIFNSKTGFFARWGETKDDDPEYSKFGSEIMDIEISTICSKGCKFCYKSNVRKGKNMTFKTFKQIFSTFPKHLTQIAFGIGDIEANPDLWKIMKYCRENNVIPNITINGTRMTNKLYDKLVKYCGAVAVSLYDYQTCFNAVNELRKRGMEQVNIHALLSEETFDNCMGIMKYYKNGDIDLNAIVFLWLKPKGNRNDLHQISKKDYRILISYAMDNNIPIGFDSCSASNFAQVLKEDYPEKYKQLMPNIEPCESTLFSYYINVEGIGYPCSFSENIEGYKGIDLTKIKEFIKDVWFHNETTKFRNNVIKNKDCNGCRMCPIYDLRLKNEK